MTDPLIVLDSLPTPTDFYRLYWNKAPFVVRGAIPVSTMENLISADELAGLAMEEAVRARLLKTAGPTQDWSCDYGPFDDQDFTACGDTHWSLLVQNVEQFHPDTAELLTHFSFAPRWMLDDIMVGFSTPGGSVGPHFDTYHVFLVQGQGQRRWKISSQPITDTGYHDGLDFKVLKDGFVGESVDLDSGDVLYVPPGYGHEGTTIDAALTYSVGLLGPKYSDLLSGFGHYLGEHEALDSRYRGPELGLESAGFTIPPNTPHQLQTSLTEHLQSPAFHQWLVEFFTTSSHQDLALYTPRDDQLSGDAFAARLSRTALFKPRYVKMALTGQPPGDIFLGFDGHSFKLSQPTLPLIQTILSEQRVSAASHPEILNHPQTFALLNTLYNHEALEFLD